MNIDPEELKKRYAHATKTKYVDKLLYKYSKELEGYNKILDETKDASVQERRSRMKKWQRSQKNPLSQIKMMDEISEKFHKE